MKPSNIQFTNPIIEEISYKINHTFTKKEGKIDTHNKFDVKIRKGKEQNQAIVSLKIEVGNPDHKEQEPFAIILVISSMFKWDGEYDEETLNSLLSVNAPALLLGYARPMIASITNMSPYPAYNLPLYNFTEQN